MSKKNGCKKCDYTGFAYAKIPCVCQGLEQEPLKRDGDIVVSDVFSFTNKPPEINPGDLVAIGDTVIGRALTSVKADGTAEILLGESRFTFDSSSQRIVPIDITVNIDASQLVVVERKNERI